VQGKGILITVTKFTLLVSSSSLKTMIILVLVLIFVTKITLVMSFIYSPTN